MPQRTLLSMHVGTEHPSDLPPSVRPTVAAPASAAWPVATVPAVKLVPPPALPCFEFEPRLPPSSIPRPIEAIRASIAVTALRPPPANDHPTVRIDGPLAPAISEAARAEYVRRRRVA